jgi:hypothetical protein
MFWVEKFSAFDEQKIDYNLYTSIKAKNCAKS